MSARLREPERARLHETFAALCRIPSPSGAERACADWVAAELRALGVRVEEDDAGARIGASAGNLVARIEGTGARWLMLCAHLDTVPPSGPLEPVRREHGWQNATPGILGADNKASVAALVELARLLSSDAAPQPVSVELVFTVAEETGLRGAGALDVSRLRSTLAFVLDQATPWGGIVHAAPTYTRVAAEIHGRAAHAGLEPERGISAIRAAAAAISAMPHGRLAGGTTVNVGTISGGSAANVVPDRCLIEGEVRALDSQRADATLRAVIDALQDGADSGGCDLDLDVRQLFRGYRLKAADPALLLAERALRELALAPVAIESGSGADANVFREHGLDCVNLANGTERAHQRTERVSDTALETGLELLLTLLELAGA